MDIFTVSFFGHRDFNEHNKYEKILIEVITDLINKYDYVDFLVGRNGEFDIYISSLLRNIKKEYKNNFSIILVLPYLTAEYKNNKNSFEKYYDEIQIYEKSLVSHFKASIKIRNCEMINKSDLIIFYVERKSGGAFDAIRYANKKNKDIETIPNFV